jgi:hypothetical protein
VVTERKRVSLDLRVAISRQIRELLSSTDGETGERLYTQQSLGAKFGVSQETIRRAQEPDGVTPAIRDAVLQLPGNSVERLLERYKHDIDSAHPDRLTRFAANAARGAADLWPDIKDLAIAQLTDEHDVPYRQAKAAIQALAGWDWGPAGPTAERWAALALAARQADAPFVVASGSTLEGISDEHRQQLKRKPHGRR